MEAAASAATHLVSTLCSGRVPVAQWTEQPPSKCRALSGMAPSVRSGACWPQLVAQSDRDPGQYGRLQPRNGAAS